MPGNYFYRQISLLLRHKFYKNELRINWQISGKI